MQNPETTTTQSGETYRFAQVGVDAVETHCALRLGDNLAHLLLLRKLAQANPQILFRHAAFSQYLPQLVEVVCDLPNVVLSDIQHHTGYSNNAWKNSGGFWESHALKNQYVPFMLEWYALLCSRIGLPCPIKSADDFAFEYPLLKSPEAATRFDVLVVNSAPLSGQWRGFDPADFRKLVRLLLDSGRDVWTTAPTGIAGAPCTAEHGFSVTAIGRLSQHCNHIVAVSTGPSWPTFNVWNQAIPRVLFIDHERLTGLVQNITHHAKIDDARETLRSLGMLP